MIEVRKLAADYGSGPVLTDVSFAAEQGRVTAILGRSGCGKSTLLKCIIGAVPYHGGEILLDGRPRSSFRPGELARQIAYLPQGKNVPDITAGRLVLHGRFPYLSYPRRYSKQDFEIAHRVMEEMGIADLEHRPMAELSGGMRQNVYLSMALAQQAPAILMDEPTTYLDAGQQHRFAALVRRLARQDKTVVLVLHDILLALRLSDRIVLLDGGVTAGSGTPQEILASGLLEKIYGLRVGTVRTGAGLQYYYDVEEEL